MALIVAFPHTRWIPIPTLFQAPEARTLPCQNVLVRLGSRDPQTQCRMPPNRPRRPGRPQSHALSRSNFLHSRANGHERLEIVIVRAHTVVSHKSSSNPPFPCSASRIKASPFLPIKRLRLRLRNKREHATDHHQANGGFRIKGYWATKLLDFRQPAIDTQGVGNRCDANCSVSSSSEIIEAAQLVVAEVEACQPACDNNL